MSCPRNASVEQDLDVGDGARAEPLQVSFNNILKVHMDALKKKKSRGGRDGRKKNREVVSLFCAQ